MLRWLQIGLLGTLVGCGVTSLSPQTQEDQRSRSQSGAAVASLEQDDKESIRRVSQTSQETITEQESLKETQRDIETEVLKSETEANESSQDEDDTTIGAGDEDSVDENTVVSSMGSGGQAGMNEVDFTASNNLASSYKINAPEDIAQKVYGLHIHLHGDGGGGYRDFPNVETRYDLIGVTVQSPNNGTSWNRDGENFAQFLDELIQDELLPKYNIDLSRIYFSTVSGGSYFMTGAFVPLYGATYKDAGAFMMCGGRAPQFDFEEENADALKEYRLHWESTNEVDRADIRNSIMQSIEAYGQALADVQGDEGLQSNQVQDDFGHCEFDGQAYTSGIQLAIDERFEVILSESEKSL